MGRVLIPTVRVAPVIRDYVERVTAGRNDGDDLGGFSILAEASGVSARTLAAIARGERPTVYLETADAVLCSLGRVDLWHLPPEQGGLADLYLPDMERLAA